MPFAVFRFTRNKVREQWITPLEQVMKYSDGERLTKLVIPVIVSRKYQQMSQVLFLRKPTRIWSLQESHANSYFLFEPPVEISDHVLGYLVANWRKEKTCRQIQSDEQETNVYRL